MDLISSPAIDSPDPLGLSLTSEKGYSAKSPRQSTVTRKLATPTKNSVRLQDFYLKTPPVATTFAKSPSRSSARGESVISPWRIRVTVDAEREDIQQSPTGMEKSSRRKDGHTVTTHVPLKSGDDTPSSPTKRPRGRPRKSLNSPLKRPGTPKPLPTRRRRNMMDILNEEAVDEVKDSTASRKRGRPAISADLETDDVDDHHGGASLAGFTTEKVAKPKDQTRPRSRGRRKAITPMKFAIDQTAEEAENPVSPGSRQGSALKEKSGNVSPPKNTMKNSKDFEIYSDSQGYKVPGLKAKAFAKRSTNSTLQNIDIATPDVSGHESLLERQDEAMWRSMLRPSFRSPQPIQRSPSTHGSMHQTHSEVGEISTDPMNDHHEFDSIMESEEFSMISTSSLPSAGQRNQGSTETSHSRMHTSTQAHTPVKPSVANSMPPPPVPSKIAESERPLNTFTSGTPRLLRVVRAGNALNGAIEPTEAVPSKSSETLQKSHHHSEQNVRSSPDDVFGGFGAGTRRELRAGLRLGEELAKRYSANSPENSGNQEEALRDQSNEDASYPKLSISESQLEQHVVSQQTQLSSPDDSEVLEEDQMSWKKTSPTRSTSSCGLQHSDSHSTSSSHYNHVDDTMMREKEAQWQREREAVSREIDMVNSSQVIIIDSDLEEQEEVDEEEDDYDVWQEEANSFEKPSEQLKGPKCGLPQATVKPSRSKLPSPWRRNSQLLYSDEFTEVSSNYSPPSKNSHNISAGNDTPSQGNVVLNHSPLVKQESALDTPACLFRVPEVIAANRSTVASAIISDQTESDILKDRQAQKTLPIEKNGRRSSTDKQASFIAYPSPETSSSSLLHETDTDVSASVPEDRWLRNPTQLVISQRIVENSRKMLFQKPATSVLDKPTLISAVEKPITKKRDLDARSPRASHGASRRPRSVQTKTVRRSASKKLSRSLTAPKAQPLTLTQPSSFLNRLTSCFPTFSFHIPFAISLPHPTPRISVDGGPLPSTPLYSHLPWTHAHFAYLYPYYSVAKRDLRAYPFNPRSLHANLVGQTMHNKCGWGKPCEEWEIGVVDKFLQLLRKYGRRRDQPLDDVPHLRVEQPVTKDERLIEGKDIVIKMFQLWVGGVVRGECEVGKGTTGEVLEGERMREKWEWPRDRWVDAKRDGKRVIEWGRLEV